MYPSAPYTKAPFVRRKVVPGNRSPAYLSYPGLAKFSYIFSFIQKMVNRLNETQKVGLARRVNPPSITLEEKARFPSSGGLCWYEISPIHENPMTLRGGSSHPPAPLIFRPN